MLLLTEEQIKDAIEPLVNHLVPDRITPTLIAKLKECSIKNTGLIKIHTFPQGQDDVMCVSDECKDCQARDMGCGITNKFFKDDINV